MQRPLLMIPGPIEVSSGVMKAFCAPPKSHVSPPILEAFGSSLESMRSVWMADASAQPFVVSGSGTLAMEMAASNLVGSGEAVLLVHTGYFSERMRDILLRLGASVDVVSAPIGQVPANEEVERRAATGKYKALFVTHVDTSTGARTDAKGLARIASEHDMLSVFDGVCATAGEEFRMAEWGADVYVTASQKAIGLPPGLALLVASQRALDARRQRSQRPPKSLDFLEWLPIMQAYEQRRPSYFATPATNLVEALQVGLAEIEAEAYQGRHGVLGYVARHDHVARAMRAAWEAMGLVLLTHSSAVANTLSAIRYPAGLGPDWLAEIHRRGVIVAGGLHPECKMEYFRIGHMGTSVHQPDWLRKTVQAVGEALVERHFLEDPDVGLRAFDALLSAGGSNPSELVR